MSIITRARDARLAQRVANERDNVKREKEEREAFAKAINDMLGTDVRGSDFSDRGDVVVDGVRFHVFTSYGYVNLGSSGPYYNVRVYTKKLENAYEVRSLIELANVLDTYGGPA